jgi:lipopolysaccharide transport system ATP-binding protein
VDGTSIYGSHSNESGFQPVRLGPNRFGFAVFFDALQLLPGKYLLRVHTLDAEGLRLFDTAEVSFVVRGETRDYGVVALPHRWRPGRGAPSEQAESTAP